MSFKEQQVNHTPGSLLTVDEAAQRMNVRPHQVEQMIKNNQLPGQKSGTETLVDVAQVDLWTSTQKRRTSALGSDEVTPDSRTAT